MKEAEILGVDIGGVILDWVSVLNGELDFDGDRYLETPEMPDAIETLKMLHAGKYKDGIYLVSKYRKERGPERIKEWLLHHNFYEVTGIPKEHVHFCTERSAKVGICKELEITAFIDDRIEVLSHMVGSIPNLYQFRPRADEVEEFKNILPYVKSVQSWKELAELLR